MEANTSAGDADRLAANAEARVTSPDAKRTADATTTLPEVLDMMETEVVGTFAAAAMSDRKAASKAAAKAASSKAE
eukprot:3586859-Pyramimonas_sp.AAC.1